MATYTKRKCSVASGNPAQIQSIQTTKETESFEFAQEVYGTQARTALPEFTETHEKIVEERAITLGAGILHIDSVDPGVVENDERSHEIYEETVSPIAKRRKATKPDKFLSFNFSAEDKTFSKSYSPKKFSTLLALDKALLAIGQSDSFTQVNGDQISFIEKIVNKGAVNGSRLKPKELQAIIDNAVANGLAQTHDTGIALTANALEILEDKKQTTWPQNSVQDVIDEYVSIAPVEDLPDELKKHAERKVGYRHLEVLSVLEIKNGYISSKHPWSEVRKQIGPDAAAPDSYKKAGEILVEKGLVGLSEVDENKMQTLSLTEDGKTIIGYLKTHTELVETQVPQEKLSIGTGYKILELIAERTDYTPGKWIYAENGSEPVTPSLSGALGISEDALARRMYELRQVKGYIEAEVTKGLSSAGTITNLRITEEGLDYINRTRATVYGKEDLIDEDAAWDLDTMTQTCVELATSLGEGELVEELHKKRDAKHVFEMSSREFSREYKSTEKLLDRLRNDYLFEFSQPKAA